MARNVKNTTENGLLDILCPYYCMGCGRLGCLLCERCKNYLKGDWYGGEMRKIDGLMRCGRREGLLSEMVKAYKYRPVRGLAKVLAGLMDEALPEMGREVVVVPLPTISRHVRERGFDHMLLLGRKLARRRGWQCLKMLRRTNNTVQVGASEETRLKQAETAYEIVGTVRPEVDYLLIDDVWTTGASMRAAEQVMRRAGARKVYKAVVATNK